MIKNHLHPRNRNREKYDISALCHALPELKEFVSTNKKGEPTIDFANTHAVRLLNTALLKYYYGISRWEFPKDNLCPPVPGRAEYIHAIADLLAESNKGIVPEGDEITCFDIGTGASCIYPILGIVEYGWSFIASDIDPESIASSRKIINSNSILKDKVTLRTQENSKNIFKDILTDKDKLDSCMCNPPFHGSKEELVKSNTRKVGNLTRRKTSMVRLNFSGNTNELIYKGGEYEFIKTMITESREFNKTVLWFTTLVSKESNIKKLLREIDKAAVSEHRILNIQTGNKKSRILAWTYHSKEEREFWCNKRWNNK